MSDRVQNIIIKLIILSIPLIAVYYTLKNLPKERVVLDDVSLKEVEKEEKKTMAIMLGDKNGVYTESDSNFWPSNKKYIFNSERSGCIDMKGNPVDGVLSYNNELMAASLTTNKTVSCYLYFDLETVAPQEFIFYLGGITNPDYTNTREIATYITYQDDDISHYCITKDTTSNNCVWNEVTDTENKVLTPNYTLDDSDTLQTVYAYLKDEAGNISPGVVDTINLDRVNPTGTIVINNGDAYSTSRTVTLTLTSSDSTYMCISENTTCTNYIDYAESYSYTFNSDGDKTIYVTYKDNAENISEQVSDSITIDTAAPSNGSVSINNNAAYSTSRTVTLTLSSSGASQMCISESTSCTNYVDYATSKSYTFSSDGTKTIYVTYKDAAGNVSSRVNDSIIVDTAAPSSNTISINNNATYSTSRTVTLTLSSSGASTLCISESTSCTNYVTYATSKSYTFSSDGTKTINVYYKDVAGNISTRVYDSIIVDTTPPSAPTTMSFVYAGWTEYPDGELTNQTLYVVRTQNYEGPTGATDANGILKYQISSDNSTWVDYNYDISNSMYKLSTTGTHKRYFRAVDNAGNAGPSIVRTAVIDVTNPKVTVTNNETTLTIKSSEAGTYCINTSSTRTNMSNCVFSGSISANSAKTTNEFTDSGTYYVHVKDSAGNIGISSAQEIVLIKTIGEYLLRNDLSGKTAYSGLYRYTGTSANNYVSLGGVLYRVIGVTDDSTTNTDLGLTANQVKLIKVESIGDYKWHSSSTSDASWNASYTVADLYTTLQGSTVIGSASVIPSTWVDKISSVNWYVGDISNGSIENAQAVFSYEEATSTKSPSQIGLMYLSDFYYAYNDGGTANCFTNNGIQCQSWILQTEEWTMGRFGQVVGSYRAWYVGSNGYVNTAYSTNLKSIRPVFYLSPDVLYTGEGDGSSGSPYQISY